MSIKLYEACIYTISTPEKLIHASRSGKPISERKEWIKAIAIFNDARKKECELPILFADARDCSALIAWSTIRSIKIDVNGTHYSIDKLYWLPASRPQDLTKLDSNTPIKDKFIKPYVKCITPDFIFTEARNPKPWMQPSSAKLGTRKYSPLVLVENEVTAGGHYDFCQDVTGERYHFPNQYRNKIIPGRTFVYYRGVRREGGKRGMPSYFGCGVIGSVYQDPANEPGIPKARIKWICEIDEYQPFPFPVPAKDGDSFLEQIPQNFWGVAVRELDESVFEKIINMSGLSANSSGSSEKELVLPEMASISCKPASGLLLSNKKISDKSGETVSRGGTIRHSKYSLQIGRRGEEIVVQYLKKTLPAEEATSLVWVADEGKMPGWDIEYRSGSKLIAIEVKATAGPVFPSLEITANEWIAAEKLGLDYRLFLVASVRSAYPSIEEIRNPAELFQNGKISLEATSWKLTRVG